MRVTIKTNKDTVILAEAIAKKKGVSLSFMVENYLRELLKMPVIRVKKNKR